MGTSEALCHKDAIGTHPFGGGYREKWSEALALFVYPNMEA